MLKEYSTVFKSFTILADLCIAASVFYLVYLLQVEDGMYVFARYKSLPLVFAVIWVAMLYFFNMYESFRIKSVNEIASIVLKAAVFSLIFFISFVFMFNLMHVTRDIIIVSIIVSAVLILAWKIALIIAVRIARKRGWNYRNILVIGTGERAKNLISEIENHNEWGLRIIGMVDKDPSRKGQAIDNHEVLGSFNDIPHILNNNVVDEVIFVVPRSWICDIEDIMRFCETEGLKVHVALDYFNLRLSYPRQTDFHGFPFLTYQCTPAKIWPLFTKRLLDIIISALALAVLSPLFIIIAAGIKLTSDGPVFFWQERCGLNGRKFRFYKFRTMFKDAEARLESLREFNEMEGPVFKMRKDPRITNIGRVLRKFSLDELPQFWHVLKGDMSLVGPRPPIPEEVKKYDYWHRRRLSMKPGLSCIWQISGRNKVSDFEEWIKLDLKYIDNWSLWLDLNILLKTIPVVLFGIGAE